MTGRRSYRNTHALFHDLSRRMNFERLPLIVTDGFEFYQKVIRRFFGPACLYGQVLPWCINTGKSLIPLILLFLHQKRNLLIPLELSRVMHQGNVLTTEHRLSGSRYSCSRRRATRSLPTSCLCPQPLAKLDSGKNPSTTNPVGGDVGFE